MTPDKFFTPLLGRSLLYPGAAEEYRGQCVQPVLMWMREQGIIPPAYPSAFDYYVLGVPGYDKIPAGAPIKTGDIIVWGSKFPPSKGNGHIDTASANGTLKDFWAYDSNWQPLVLSKVHHNDPENNYIIGYLRRHVMPNISRHDVGRAAIGLWGPVKGKLTEAQFAKYTQVEQGVMLKRMLDDPMTDAWITEAAQLKAGAVTHDSALKYVQDNLK